MLEDNMSLENEQENNLPLTSDVGYNLESAQASALSSLSETAQALTVAINKIAAYVPTQWVNGTEPDIDEDNLNKIEEGIKNATNAVNSSIDAITELAAAVDTLNGKIGYIDIEFTSPEFVEAGGGGVYRFQYPITNKPELVGKTIISIFFYHWSTPKGVFSVGLDNSMSLISILKSTNDTPNYIKVRVVYMN